MFIDVHVCPCTVYLSIYLYIHTYTNTYTPSWPRSIYTNKNVYKHMYSSAGTSRSIPPSWPRSISHTCAAASPSETSRMVAQEHHTRRRGASRTLASDSPAVSTRVTAEEAHTAIDVMACSCAPISQMGSGTWACRVEGLGFRVRV